MVADNDDNDDDDDDAEDFLSTFSRRTKSPDVDVMSRGTRDLLPFVMSRLETTRKISILRDIGSRARITRSHRKS